jgi:hypothetical protein
VGKDGDVGIDAGIDVDMEECYAKDSNCNRWGLV